ncbi:ABC transporter substrate-binding protein [Spelaeicoccus albus]|uniref:NitT/TauT family transport system substrate-binding protein n=1 Tax=Spelaeicoccus albus TaxID=1280376 RepID=A0A7Z0D057_9MICO|nr:ABC transporter substrate-binding protein [Spelaeicoccus albus]NYI66954.1 NitT/TauT family transport system substrate-binding protein [Spelaeicoccus albus]
MVKGIAVAVTVVGLLGITACNPAAKGHGDAAGSDSGGDDVIIAVAGLSNLHNVPLVVARSLGYYKDEGVNVQLQDLQAGSRALQAMMSGSAQAAASFYDHTLDMQHDGKNVTSWVTLSTSPGAVLVVPPKHAREIDSVKDLKGHPIGVSAPGSAEDQYMAVALNRAGMSEADIGKISIGTGSSAVAALEKGKVYAAWMFEPAFSQFAARNPGTKTIIDTRTAKGMQDLFGSGGYAAETLYSKTEWLDAHGAQAKKVNVAIVRALKWMASHSAKQIASKIPADLKGKDSAAYVRVLHDTLPIFTKDGAMPKNGYKGNVQLLKIAEGYTNLKPKKTFTNDYLPH